MNRKRLVPILVLSGALAGCAAMQERPLASTEDAQSLGLPAEGMAGQERQEWAVKPPISPHWWRALGDVKLDALVDRALAHSPIWPWHRPGCGRPRPVWRWPIPSVVLPSV